MLATESHEDSKMHSISSFTSSITIKYIYYKHYCITILYCCFIININIKVHLHKVSILITKDLEEPITIVSHIFITLNKT